MHKFLNEHVIDERVGHFNFIYLAFHQEDASSVDAGMVDSNTFECTKRFQDDEENFVASFLSYALLDAVLLDTLLWLLKHEVGFSVIFDVEAFEILEVCL